MHTGRTCPAANSLGPSPISLKPELAFKIIRSTHVPWSYLSASSCFIPIQGQSIEVHVNVCMIEQRSHPFVQQPMPNVFALDKNKTQPKY